MRINARLNDSYEQRLLQIQQLSGKTRTEIVKEALDQYLQKTLNDCERTALANNRQILELLGGIAEGPEDLSGHHKEEIEQGLKEKYGID